MQDPQQPGGQGGYLSDVGGGGGGGYESTDGYEHASYSENEANMTPRRGRRKSAMNFIKRKFMSKGDDVATNSNSDYDSDRSSRSNSKRGWGKAKSAGTLDSYKPRSMSRDSSPGRLRSYLDQYRRDDSNASLNNNKNKNSGRQTTDSKGSGRTNSARDGYIQGAEDYAPTSTPVENDIPVPAHEFNKVQIRPTVSGYKNLLHKIYDGVDASDTEVVQENLSLSRSSIRRKPSSTDDEAELIPSSRSSAVRQKASTDDDEADVPATPNTKAKKRIRRKPQRPAESDDSDGGDDDDDNEGKTKPRPVRRTSIPKRTDDSQMGEMPLKKGSPDDDEELSSVRRRKSSEPGSIVKKKKGTSGRGMSSKDESKRSLESESSSLNNSKSSFKTKGAGSKKTTKKSGDAKRDRSSGVRSTDRSVASFDSKITSLSAKNSLLPNLPEQQQHDSKTASLGDSGDLMDAPVPPRRKFNSFKEDKEKMERELLFTKLEVVRLQEQLAEAVEKTEALDEMHKKEKLAFEKVATELEQVKGQGNGSGNNGNPAAAGLDYEHRRKLHLEISQLKREINEKDAKIDSLNDKVQEHICKVEHLEEELKSAEEDMANMQNDMANLENELAAKEQEEDAWLTDDDDSDKPMKKDEKTRRQKELEDWEKRLELRERELKQQEAKIAKNNDELNSSKNRGVVLGIKDGVLPSDDFDDEGSVEMTQLEKSPGDQFNHSSIKSVPDNMTQMAMEVMEKEMAEMRSWVVKSAKELDADRAQFDDNGPEKIKQLTEEVEKLRSELEAEKATHEEELQKTEKLAHSYLKDLEMVEDLLQDEKKKRKEDAAYLDEMEREINQQMKDISEEKQSLEFKLERAQRRADTTESKLDSARMDIQDHLSKIAELQKVVTEVKYAPAHDSKLEQELERLQLKNDQLREKMSKFEEMQGNRSSSSLDRGAPAPPTQSDDRQFLKELNRLQSKNDSLREKLQKYESQGGNFATKSSNSTSNNDEKIRSLQEQVTFLKLDLKDKASLTDSLKDAKQKLEIELADAHEKRERESERLQDTIEELIMCRDELEDELEVFRKEREEEVKRLSSSVGKLQDENEKLEEKVRQVGGEGSKQTNEVQEEEIARLRDSVATLSVENETLKEKVNAVTGEQSRQIDTQAAEIVDLRGLLDKAKKENGELEERLHGAVEDQSKSTVKVQEAEIAKLRGSVENLKKENATLAERVTDATGDHAKKTVKVQEAEIMRLQNQLKDTFRQFEKRHPKEFPALLQELKIRKGEVDTVRKSMYEVQERNKKLETEIMEMSQRLEFDMNVSKNLSGDGSDHSLTFGDEPESTDAAAAKAPSDELKAIQEELKIWKTTATTWKTKAEESVQESVEWKKRAEEWEQEAAQWETVATESQAAAALGTDEQAMALAAMDVTTRLQPQLNGAENDEERIRGLSRQNAALNERIAEIQNELKMLVGSDGGTR